MVKELIFGIVGGLGLFIYGIHLMGEGLNKAAGDKMRSILSALTKTPFIGVLVGAGVTAIIQSSSATTVMVVGFVNAGLITLNQALGVIFGANIGTTITAQLIAFKLTDYALPIIGLGALIFVFGRKRNHRYIAEAISGFGILFLGLAIMTTVVKPVGNNLLVKQLFINFSKHPLLGIATGMIVTMILQSSSVTVGLVLALASVGLLDLSGAIPLILGDNIGTCITALLASIGTNVFARRAALAHLMFNVIGVIIFFPILPFYQTFVSFTAKDVMRQCANAHSLFNIFNTLLFLPFTGAYARLVTKLLPGEEVMVATGPQHLEKRLLYVPVLALKAVTQEIIHTLEITKKMVNDAMDGFFNEDIHALEKVTQAEDVVDTLRAAITEYLVALMSRHLTEEQAKKIPALIHIINDIERIGDHAENLRDLALRKVEQKLPFSEYAQKELQQMRQEITQMCDDAIVALSTNDVARAKTIIERETKINQLRDEFNRTHVERLEKGVCRVLSGVVFLEMVSNFERIGDHLNNVGQAVMRPLQWEYSESK